MKPFIAFLKMQLNINYGVSALKYRFTRDKKKLWEPVLIAVAIIVTLLPLLALYTGMMLSLFAAGSLINQPEMVLAVSFMFAQAAILFFGIFYIMGTFYFSNDMETYVPLPLKPYEVVGGKFAVIMVNEYLTSVPLLLPPIIIYGIGTSQGFLYWLKSLLLMLAVPAMPLAAATLVIMLIMRFVNLRRYKDLLAVVGGMVAIIAGIGVNLFIQNISNVNIQEFFASRFGLIELIGRRFPPVVWAVRGLSDSGAAGFGYLFLFIAVCALLFMLMLWLSNQVFYRALLAGQEVRRKRKSLTEEQAQKRYGRVSSPAWAMMKRDWKLLYRTPIYMLNGLIGPVIGPLIILVMFMAQRGRTEFAEIVNELQNPETVPYGFLAGLALMLFTGGMNLVASTALSREGQTIWITKMIPVTARQQVNVKLLISLAVTAIGVVATAVIIFLVVKMPILWVIGMIALGMLGSFPMVALGLLVDIFHPKLVWNSEQEAMKQNMNGAIGMLLSILVLLILGAVAVTLLLLKVPMSFVIIAIAAASIIFGVLSLLALYAVAERKYRELEA